MSVALERSDVLTYARAFRQGMLHGSSSSRMCAAVSAPLRAALMRLGIETELVESDLGECNHIFLKLSDGLVLDPTADQFNCCSSMQMPEVYLGPYAAIHARSQPWAGGAEWIAFMEEIQRLVPDLDAEKVGRGVSFVLQSLPGGLNTGHSPNQTSF